MGFYPLTARLQKESFKLISSIAHSNTVRIWSTSNITTESDYALSQLTLHPSFNLNNHIELSFNLGVIYYWGGFLDSFVSSYHGWLNLPNGQRDRVSDFKTKYRIATSEFAWIERDKPTASLRDTMVMTRVEVLDSPSTIITVAVAAEFPTGNKLYGVSNGANDYGLAFYFDQKIFIPQFYFYYIFGYMYLGRFQYKGVKLPHKSTKWQHAITLEWLPNDFWATFQVQVIGEESVYETDNEFLDKDAWILNIGFTFLRTNKSLWQFIFTEDLNYRNTPDFTLQLSHHRSF